MVRHIVMFRLHERLSPTEIEATIQQAQSALEALPDQIEVLQALSVHRNINPEEPYHFALVADLPTLTDVPTYAQHPAHVKIVQEIIKPLVAQRACVDIELP